jgi:hypothetical protein
VSDYDPAADPVHGSGMNSAARWGGWHWEKPRGAEHFRRCSFCGSISPVDLAAETAGTGCGYTGCPAPHNELAGVHFPVAGSEDEDGRHRFVNTGWRASWADRKYGWPHKFYVEGVANRNPGTLRIITALSPGQEDRIERETGYQWYPVGEIPAGTDVSGWRLEDGHYSHVGLGSDRTHFVKFYTLHLAGPAVSDEVKETISRVCGLRFTFEDGLVRWEPYATPVAGAR